MVSNDKVFKAIGAFLDNELMPNLSLNPLQKVMMGTGMGIALNKYKNVIPTLNNNQLIKMLGIIDDEGNIDIETLTTELKKNIPNDGLPIDIPMLGKLTFHKEDVDKLNEYLQMV